MPGPELIGEIPVPGRITVREASTTGVGELVAGQPLSDRVVRNTAIFRDVTNIPPLFAILTFEPLPVLIESRGLGHEAVHMYVVISLPPNGPPTLLLEPGGLIKRPPSLGESEAMVRSSRDLLPVSQDHPENVLGAILEDVHHSRVGDPSRLLIHLTQPHPPHTVAPEVRIPLLVRTVAIDGRLKSIPHFLDGQLVKLIPPAADAPGKVEINLGPLGQAGRPVPYPLTSNEHRHRTVELELDHLTGCRVVMTPQVAHEPPCLAHLAGAVSVADARRPLDVLVGAHVVHQ